ncbi:MAG: hybrid sensor histidine kinase/response regulator [Elusimicrobia bacterium]|nr:hybrid sensor histidine kinase/response regulator [Elusimicrobiota bacterium]
MSGSLGRLLVVDDEELVRALCTRTLTAMGVDVESACSAKEAWERLREKEFDCVLTDISMPGAMDGAALTEEVRGRFPATDMLIMTGHPTVQTAVSTLKLGARDYLTKPFKPLALESAVARCFERRRLSAELNREKALRQELEAAYAELQKVERAKNTFISILNHELRTPLAIAISAVELLDDACDPARAREVVKMAKAGLAREKEVIEDLLMFSGLTSGELQVQSLPVHPEELIGSLVENYRSVWEAKQLRMHVVFEKAPPPVQGDRALLQTAFKHLILNAIHFNMKGGEIHIEGKTGEGVCELLFADTGIGIAPDQQALIFDRFYQVAEHMTRKVGGLGLGLAIVRRIVEAHGGLVTVRARRGGGSEFLVRLPLSRP